MLLKDLEGFLEDLGRDAKQVHDSQNTRIILRDLRTGQHLLDEIEGYGVTVLQTQTPDVGRLNQASFRIHQEIKHPLSNPVVSCSSTDGFFTPPFGHVIFVPLTSADFLLHLPDLYHEIGHIAIRESTDNAKLRPLRDAREAVWSEVARFYVALIKKSRWSNDPPALAEQRQFFFRQWQSWIDEFVADLFAVFTVGPCYAWAHILLTLRNNSDVHALHLEEPQTHPPPEVRFRVMVDGLRLLGHTSEILPLQSSWRIQTEFSTKPAPEYALAFPDAILAKLPDVVLEALRKCGYGLATPHSLASEDVSTVRGVLNAAWRTFRGTGPSEYRSWERRAAANLATSMDKLGAFESRGSAPTGP